VFFACWSVACFVAGLWMGEERATEAPKVYDKPVTKKLSVHDMTKQQTKRWAKYLATRGM
jgi:hypothetical protein